MIELAYDDDERGLPLPQFANPPKLLIVAAPYQVTIVNLLVQGAEERLAGLASFEQIKVPGALEIAPAIQIAANGRKFDGFVALGCVIRGDTTHYETVCDESARGLTALGLSGICVGNGILTVESEEQGLVRAHPKKQDKGGEAAAAALHLIAIRQRFKQPTGTIGFNK